MLIFIKKSIRIVFAVRSIHPVLVPRGESFMCGITGIVAQENVGYPLVEAMESLEYRGYDSAGVATLNGYLDVRKDIGKLAEVEDRLQLSAMKGTAGIAHTRWATHGGVTRENAHPHTSGNEFAIVHNGIIENYRTLRANLEAEGYVFCSETDSEVIAHLIAAHYRRGLSIEQALRAAAQELQGAYAFALVTTHAPETLFCAKNESPLVIGIGSNAMYLASDANAFAPYTKTAIYLEDGQYAILEPTRYAVRSTETGWIHFPSPETLSDDMGRRATMGHYPNYMSKEIEEGALCVEHALAIPHEQIQTLAEKIAVSRQTYFTGMGTAFYVAQIAQYYFASLADRYIPAISADEFLALAKLRQNDLVLAVSQSGETYDTLKALRYAKQSGAKTAAVVNVPGSTMTREVDQAIMQGSGPEMCVLSTKSTVAQIAILLRVALEVGKMDGIIPSLAYAEAYENLVALPDLLRETYEVVIPQARSIADLAETNNWFFIGRGIYNAIAYESALKFKEVTYQHAEGMPAGFLKHGSISLIDESMHTIAFLPTTEESGLLNATLSNIQEIRARKGLVVGVHHQKDEILSPNFDLEVILPPAPALIAPFLQLTAGQMIAYHAALRLGRNIDKPRGLAKSVTVV